MLIEAPGSSSEDQAKEINPVSQPETSQPEALPQVINFTDRAQGRSESLLEKARGSVGKVAKAASMFAATTLLAAGLSPSVDAAPSPDKKTTEPAQVEKGPAASKNLYTAFSSAIPQDEDGKALLVALKKLSEQEDLVRRLREKQKQSFDREEFAAQHAGEVVMRFTRGENAVEEEAERQENLAKLNAATEQLGDSSSSQDEALEKQMAELREIQLEQGAARLERLIVSVITSEGYTFFELKDQDKNLNTVMDLLKADEKGSFRGYLKNDAPGLEGLINGLRQQYPKSGKGLSATMNALLNQTFNSR